MEIEARFVMPTPCVPVKCEHIKITKAKQSVGGDAN